MASALDNGLALWTIPFGMAKLAADWTETMLSAGDVIDERLPMINRAFSDPLGANHGELSRMVTEKVAAFGKSGRSISAAQEKIRRAAGANARALGHLSGGGVLGFADWLRMGERNIEIAATLAMMPAAALAPIQARATANARRLRKA